MIIACIVSPIGYVLNQVGDALVIEIQASFNFLSVTLDISV